jgi:hypothetical protein
MTTEVSLSDHRIIRFKIIPYRYKNQPLLYRLVALFKRTGLFDARLGKDILSTCTIDECAPKIQSTIINAREKSCLLKTASGVQNTPYWSSELENLRKRARKAWNYRLTDTDAY